MKVPTRPVARLAPRRAPGRASPAGTWITVAAAAGALAAPTAGCGEAFSSGEPGTGGGTASTTTVTTSTSTSTSSSGTTTNTTATDSTTSTTSAPCTFDACAASNAKPPQDCTPCVTEVCDEFSIDCCEQAWIAICTWAAAVLCDEGCTRECVDIFQGVSAICGDNGDVCTVVEADAVSCDTICSTAGTECSWASKILAGGTQCGAGEEIGCGEMAGPEAAYVKCDCHLGCGTGPACLPGWRCANGTCTNT